MLIFHVIISVLLAKLAIAQQFTSSEPEHDVQRSKNVISQDLNSSKNPGWFRIIEASGLVDAAATTYLFDGSHETTYPIIEVPANFAGDLMTISGAPVVIRGNYKEGFLVYQKMKTTCGEAEWDVESEHHMLFKNGATRYSSPRWTGYNHSAVGDSVFGLTTEYILDDTVPDNDTQFLERLSKKIVIEHPGLNSESCRTEYTYNIKPGPHNLGENACRCQSIMPNDDPSIFEWSEKAFGILFRPQLLVKKYVYIIVLTILWLLIRYFVKNVYVNRQSEATEAKKLI